MAENNFFQFLKEMQSSDKYIKRSHLKDGYVYQIYARNAYIGIWLESKNSFLIARHKSGSNPKLAFEDHWDDGNIVDVGLNTGTVKPLKLLGESPFTLEDYKINADEVISYLEGEEINNPVCDGYNTLEERKKSAINFEKRLKGDKRH